MEDDAATDRILTSAKAGSAVWVLLFILQTARIMDLGVVPLAVLLAPLVVVPLGVMLSRRILPEKVSPVRSKMEAAGILIAAVLAAASFALPKGIASAALAAVWLATVCVIGLFEFPIIWRSDISLVERVCLGAAFLYLPVGAVWLVGSRLGIAPMGFEEPFVLLTAAHFHFSGFAAALLVGAGWRALSSSRPGLRRIYAPLALGAAAGPALVAAGFVLSPALKAGAALIFSISLAGCSILALLAVFNLWSGTARFFLSISTACIFAGMVFACVYALGDFAGKSWIGIPRMAELHGITNSFGYVLCGLLGWLTAQESPQEEPSMADVCSIRAVGGCQS